MEHSGAEFLPLSAVPVFESEGTPVSKRKTVIAALVLAVVGAATAFAQIPDPMPDQGEEEYIFYGLTPLGGATEPVIIFIPGLRGTASDWWTQGEGDAVDNEMYLFAYRARFRTAFISLSPDNSRNDESIEFNATVLKKAIPKIADRYGVDKVYVVAHSKGGLDLQEAMLEADVRRRIKGVFTVSTPNNGAALADWAFGAGHEFAALFGLTTPGIRALQTHRIQKLREEIDPILVEEQIPFFTVSGNSSRGPLTGLIGLLLSLLEPGPNDGFVSVASAQLPRTYATEMGEISANHFEIDRGDYIWPKIYASIVGLESVRPGWDRIATNGFGDIDNTWNWSMEWFKGKLFVGTGRAVQCVTFATAAVQVVNPLPFPLYPAIGNRCANDYKDLALAAEIWAFTPETRSWERVYRSPEDVPIDFDHQGRPTKYTARDIGYRGMIVFKEQDGTEALYVGSTTAASVYQPSEYYQHHPYPPPRILRSVDGVNFQPLPQEPGTTLGDILEDEALGARGFRSFAALHGKLFVTATDFRGLGFIIVADRPELGNDAWQRASGSVLDFPVWTLHVYNDHLYCVTGDNQFAAGYGVYRTDGKGSPPYDFTPIVTAGAHQTASPSMARAALSFGELDGILYVGTDRPPEMIRIFPDDSWDLVIGNPRATTAGFKTPLSSVGQRFDNLFNGHFWRMTPTWDKKRLYMGTWDNAVSSRTVQLLDGVNRGEYGTNVYSTQDGVRWNLETKQGFGDPMNYGTRSFAATPFGTFLGTAQATDGSQVFLEQSQLDFDEDGDIDRSDATILGYAATNAPAKRGDPRDLDEDGFITSADVKALRTQCDKPNCENVPPSDIPPDPQNLISASAYALPDNLQQQVILSWDRVPGAQFYRILRSEVRSPIDLLPANLQIRLPGVPDPIRIPEDLLPGGAFDTFCSKPENAATLPCFARDIFMQVDANGQYAGIGLPFIEVAATDHNFYAETGPTALQSLYYVVADFGHGRTSPGSNLIGGPSYALPVTFVSARLSVDRVTSNFSNPETEEVLEAIGRAEADAIEAEYESAGLILEEERDRLQQLSKDQSPAVPGTIELARILTDLIGTIRFVAAGVYEPIVPTLGPEALESLAQH